MRKAKRYSEAAAKSITINVRHNLWGQGRSLTISRLTAGILSMVFAGFLITAGYFTYHYLYLSYDRAHIADLKARNLQQSKQVEAMESEVDQLKAQQEKVIEEHNNLKKIMGYDPEQPLSNVTPSRGGQGGGERNARESILPQEFTESAGTLTEELSITQWENSALQRLLSKNPNKFLSLPSMYPVDEAELTSDFGLRSNPFKASRGEVHHGLDLAGDVGNNVYAAGKGRVIYAAWDSTYGRLIKIDHGNGLISWYGHNYRMQVKKGQEVERGDIIALMGSSGRSTGPHVHFAIEKDGEFISPWQYLP